MSDPPTRLLDAIHAYRAALLEPEKRGAWGLAALREAMFQAAAEAQVTSQKAPSACP